AANGGESRAAWGIGGVLASGRAVGDQSDVGRWGVRARGTARLVMRSDQIQRPLRAKTRRKHWAPATTAFRPAPMRRRDGSARRSGNGRPRGVHGRLDWAAQ